MSVLTSSQTGQHPRKSRRPGLRDILTLRSQRRKLDKLDDHRLDDIGLTRADAAREAGRPFWDMPDICRD